MGFSQNWEFCPVLDQWSRNWNKNFDQTSPSFEQTIFFFFFWNCYTNRTEYIICFTVDDVAIITQTGISCPSAQPFSLDLSIILLKLFISRPLNEWLRSSSLKGFWDIAMVVFVAPMVMAHTCTDYVGKANRNLLESWARNHHSFLEYQFNN